MFADGAVGGDVFLEDRECFIDEKLGEGAVYGSDVCLSWSFNRSRNRRDRGFVKNQFDVFERLQQQVLVRDTTVDEINIAANLIEVLAMARRQIIEDSNTRSTRA